eukprot:2485644-Pleurochrysis_carterae.AAC.4
MGPCSGPPDYHQHLANFFDGKTYIQKLRETPRIGQKHTPYILTFDISAIQYDLTCRWTGRLSPRILGPSPREWPGRQEVLIQGANPPCYTVQVYMCVHRIHNSCAASNKWCDSGHRAALTVQLLGGYPSTPPSAGSVSRLRPVPS